MVPLRIMIFISLSLVLYQGNYCFAATNVWTVVRDFLQHNLVGAPIVHEQTQWTFDPEIGKQKRARYEAENGKHGEIAIAKIGMGIGYVGPWGTPVKS